MAKMIGYCRVSTEIQERDGVSLGAQEELIRAHCINKNYELVDVIRDAVSGKSLHRDGIQRALQMLRDHKADGLIVTRLDRLTRSVIDAANMIERDFQHKQLISLNENVDTTTAIGRMMLNMITIVSQWERETIRERILAAVRHKKKKGEKLGGGVPYGYKVIEEGGKKLLALDKAEQRIVASIMDMKEHQGMTETEIANELWRRGITNRVGNKMQPVQVMRIIERESLPEGSDMKYQVRIAE